MNKSKKKRDLLLIVIILIISALLFLGIRLMSSKPATKVEISVDGEVIGVFPLSENTDLTVQGFHGGTNHLVIEGGRIRADEATCPDKICVNQGWIDRTGESVVCLPNRMIARIIGED